MAEEQYLTEKHYLTCSNGATPLKIKVDSQEHTLMSKFKAATVDDIQKENNFICLGPVAFAAGAVAGVLAAACALIPGPGWIVAAIIIAAIIAAAAIGYMKCKAAIPTRSWKNPAPALSIENKKALLLSSFMECKGQGGIVTPRATLWEAWGHQALTNLGHLANFAFGFLVGRGMANMAIGATSTAGGVSALATRQGATTFAKEFGRQFLNTAKKDLIEQFTFTGFSKAPFWCKVVRGLGIGGAYYDQYRIWSSDKDVVDKLKESGINLVLSVFAASGASKSCFPEETKVHTPDGLRNIEDLQVGDLVLTYNEETLEQEYKPILVKHERYTMQMLTMELPTGEFLQVTPEHRFYHNGEWIEARSLKPGDLLHLKNGDYTTIMGIETLPRYQKVYNFEIKDNKNYYVTEDGILVHNRYDERQITQVEYDKLRTATPNKKIKNKVNEGANFPFPDEALPGLTVTKKLHADHIVSMDEITRMDGFGKLTKKQQLKVLNNEKNFIGLSETANTSKGSKSYEQWIEYKKGGIKVDETFRQTMIKRAEEVKKTLQTQINDLLKE